MINFFKYEKILFIFSVIFFLWLGGFFIYHFLILGKQTSQSPEVDNNIIKTSIKVNKPFQIKGSIPYWDQKNAYDSFKKSKESFDYINLFWYYIGEDGGIQKYEYANENESIIDFAHKNNIKVHAVITNLTENPEKWNSGRVEEYINSNEKRKIHIDKIIDKLNEKKFDGVIIDYEMLKADTKENYSLFIKELSAETKKENKTVTVVLHPKTGENVKGESLGRYQDWVSLVSNADQAQIMGYSEHSNEDDPGPVASISWVGKIIEYAKTLNIPHEKLFLGIPLYGYDWDIRSTGSAKGVTYEEVVDLANKKAVELKFDNLSKSPYFKYENHLVWFENSRSVVEKADLAYDAGFGGITFWRLGGEDQEVWEKLSKYRD